MSEESTPFRKPTRDELRLLRALVRAARLNNTGSLDEDAIEVKSLDDGGMGSIKIRSRDDKTHRAEGRYAAEIVFDDSDGVKVVASLYLDDAGLPLEIDIWRTDFQPLKRIPAYI